MVAAAVVVAVAMATGVLPWANGPVATTPTAAPTNEPLPSSVSPSASPTVGELSMGRVAISTQNGVPALAVRVITLPSPAGEAVIRIDLRVVGPLTEAVGAPRFGVYHDGTTDPLPAGSDTDALAISSGAALGTTVYAEFTIPVRNGEWADLGYQGVAGFAAFTYPLHRPPVVNEPTDCPTLADYAAASAIPSQAPAPAPSFDPVAADTTATTGTIARGTGGVIAGPDGKAGALVRVSNARLCDRLPDARPDAVLNHLYPSDAPAQFLFADVDLLVLQDSTIDIFLPGGDTVFVPLLGGRASDRAIYPRVFWFPGINPRSSVDNGAGYSYHGVIGWVVPGGIYAGAELSLGVFRGNVSGMTPLFAYPVRAGTPLPPVVPVPSATPLPSLTPAGSPLPLDTEVVLPIDGQVVRAVVGGVQQVPRYPAVTPSKPGDVFLEYAFESVRASGDYTWNPADWSVVLQDGSTAPMLVRPAGDATPNGWPNYPMMYTEPATIDHAMALPAFSIAEVPVTGRITLEYRPSGGPAVATWVLREE